MKYAARMNGRLWLLRLLDGAALSALSSAVSKHRTPIRATRMPPSHEARRVENGCVSVQSGGTQCI
jgi:hypothetical protein